MKTAGVWAIASLAAAFAALPSMASSATVNPALAGLNPVAPLRVTRVVDNQMATLGNTHLALLNHLKSTGNVPDSFPMNHMQMILRPGATRG